MNKILIFNKFCIGFMCLLSCSFKVLANNIFCFLGFLCSSFSISTKPKIGVAHHVSFMRPYGLFDIAAISLANSLTLFPYVDSIADKLDFIGINYYGQVLLHFPPRRLCPYCSYILNILRHKSDIILLTLIRKWFLVLD